MSIIDLYNPITNVDSYAYSHWKQYPKNTTNVFSYIESRGGFYDKTIFFGLQYFLKEYFCTPITQENINEASAFVEQHMGPDIFNKAGWQYILDVHSGYLPLRICSVAEGTIVPTHNVLVTIENTDPACFWLGSYFEAAILRAAWYGTTVATNSYAMKQTIKKYLELTGDVSLLSTRLHDFGFRGVSSFESACIGAASHLINFIGTDTGPGIKFAQKYYNETQMLGFSIPAAQHSTTTSWGGRDGEVKSFENMIDQFAGQDKLYAVVSDSYDIYHAIIQHWGTTLREKVIQSGGTLVVRPDSGDLLEVTLNCVELLGDKFGFSVNEKGYKILNPCVRLIQGDGIDNQTVGQILANYAKNGWSSSNIAFGCGGGLLQKLDRDSLKFAYKCSSVDVDEQQRDVYKDPITDKVKKSKKGRLMLFRDRETQEYFTDLNTRQSKVRGEPMLMPVFENGRILTEYSFTQVRANSEK